MVYVWSTQNQLDVVENMVSSRSRFHLYSNSIYFRNISIRTFAKRKCSIQFWAKWGPTVEQTWGWDTSCTAVSLWKFEKSLILSKISRFVRYILWSVRWTWQKFYKSLECGEHRNHFLAPEINYVIKSEPQDIVRTILKVPEIWRNFIIPELNIYQVLFVCFPRNTIKIHSKFFSKFITWRFVRWLWCF